MGSSVLDWAESVLDGLEIRSGHRSTRDGDFMATETIQTILVAIVAEERTRPAANQPGDSEAGPIYGCRQSALGRTTNPRRTPQTRL